MKRVLLAAVLAGVASSALAADLPTYKAPPAPSYYAPLPFTWTGFYAGANLGWAFGSVSNSNFGNPSTALFGAQAGYNMQMNQFVLGLEADIEGTGMPVTSSGPLGSNKFGTHTLTTERVRAGFAMDRTLFYLTGGYAGVQTTASYAAAAGGSGYASQWRNGGAIGAGVEYALTNNITTKIEYLYLPFSSANYFSGTPAAENSDLSLNIVRAGLNYKF